MRTQMADQIRPFIDVYRVAGHGYVDEVIDPRETRKVLLHALDLTVNKTVERPPRKKGVVPV
jgi:propionyl-CoA carboxylase beta chain